MYIGLSIIRQQVPVSWFLETGWWLLGSGHWFLVPCHWLLVPASSGGSAKDKEPVTRNQPSGYFLPVTRYDSLNIGYFLPAVSASRMLISLISQRPKPQSSNFIVYYQIVIYKHVFQVNALAHSL